MLIAVLSSLLLQTAPTLDTPGIVLILSSDTAFVVPTNSIGREGTIRRATLVEIFAGGSDDWETARRDNDLEIDCEGRRMRFITSRTIDGAGRLKDDEPISSEWEPLETSFPPFGMLEALTCSDDDLTAISHASLEAELPRLREQLDDY